MNTSEIIRAVRRAEIRKARLCQRLGRAGLPFAFDADELAEMSASELAIKVLEKLGLNHDTENPVSALMSYLEGRESARDAGRDLKAQGLKAGSAHDAAESGSFVDSYLNS
jgi:hypothetical protein